MSEILEVHWGRPLIESLCRWIEERGQLRQPTATDMGTPQMVSLTVARRRTEVLQAVQELRTVLDAHAVKVLDLDLHERLRTIGDGSRKGGEGDAP